MLAFQSRERTLPSVATRLTSTAELAGGAIRSRSNQPCLGPSNLVHSCWRHRLSELARGSARGQPQRQQVRPLGGFDLVCQHSGKYGAWKPEIYLRVTNRGQGYGGLINGHSHNQICCSSADSMRGTYMAVVVAPLSDRGSYGSGRVTAASPVVGPSLPNSRHYN